MNSAKDLRDEKSELANIFEWIECGNERLDPNNSKSTFISAAFYTGHLRLIKQKTALEPETNKLD